MKILILYHSYYKNNTEKIAQKFSQITACDLINVQNIKEVNINIDEYNLIGFGSGVYRESLSPKIFRLVDKLDLRGKNVFVFSTSGIGMKFYNNRLFKLLKSKEAIIQGSFACKGSFIAKEFTNIKIFNIMSRLSQGHPNDKDLKDAERFIVGLLESS